MFWVYLLLVVSVTIFPIPLPAGANGMEIKRPAAEILSRVNLVPLRFGGLFSLHPNVIFHELAGNILLTIPFGFGICLLAPPRARVLPVLAVGTGLAIETAQLLVCLGIGGSYRGVDINDVLLNAAGVWIGWGVFKAFVWVKNRLM